MKKAIYMGLTFRPRSDVDARIFKVEPPLEGYDFVRVSATDMSDTKRIMKKYNSYNQSDYDCLQPETYIFGCNCSGDIISWAELDGSYRGGMSHAQALQNAGYEIVSSSD